ncbi:hypothetical protein GCM10009117_05140 [Gangjinia marincola]|uniref:Beta-lactamase-related domain-containing protein n=1 Tax=Gangjinia marincola TaxID=578463 RepID=A0ABN1ME32_9FLAO
MKKVFQISLIIISLISFSCGEKKNKPNTPKENRVVDNYSAKIDSLIQTTNPRKFNGVILITQKGEIKYSKAHVYSDFENKTPISLSDNFRIQSNSKQITAVLILKEFEKGNINLHTSIKQYLPGLKATWANAVTVHQLLNMSSGISSIEDPLLFEPGTDFYYSNPAYGLLGKIIKNVTGSEYVEIANELFKELGMNRTYCYELGMINNELINGYGNDNETKKFMVKDIDKNLSPLPNPKESWKNFIPAGGIISNLNDLRIWDEHLHKGDLLKPETYKLMISSDDRRTDYFKAYGEEKIGYGYGVCISNEPLLNIGHPGKGLGFGSYKFYVPDTDLSVIVLQNLFYDDSEIFFHFEKEIRKIVLNSSLVK